MNNDESRKMIGLIRVSTGKQEKSGLGLDAQRDAIDAYRKRTERILVKTYIEVESGKYDDIEDRPVLDQVLSHCARANAVLVVAKIDRLTRSLSVYSDIKRRGVGVVALDLPDANELTTDIMVAVKAEERRTISKRTRDALAAFKDHKRVSKKYRELYPDGVPEAIEEARAGKLGAHLPECQNRLTAEGRAAGSKRAALRRSKKARQAFADLAVEMQKWRKAGLTLQAIADRLNEAGHETRHHKSFGPVQVKRVLDRIQPHG